MRISELERQLADLGALACHRDRFLRAWTQNTGLDNKRQKAENFFPAPMRAALPALQSQLTDLVQECSAHPGADGSSRLLLSLYDGQQIESVLLPRDGVCVSTQVGCAVACQFCMTGKSGLIRQLSSGEIVAQVVLARQKRPLRRVVFMGMGEPAHNLDNVMEAIELLGRAGGFGHKNLVFSTVGDRRVFERLPQGPVKPALAISLHTTDPLLRRQLLPKAAELTPEELIEAGERYARQTGYPIQYQWTLLEGINDSNAEVESLIRQLKGKYAMMNFIPFNQGEGLDFRRPGLDVARRMAAQLNQAGIVCRLRDSAGQDVDGGCGQLRARIGRQQGPEAK